MLSLKLGSNNQDTTIGSNFIDIPTADITAREIRGRAIVAERIEILEVSITCNGFTGGTTPYIYPRIAAKATTVKLTVAPGTSPDWDGDTDSRLILSAAGSKIYKFAPGELVYYPANFSAPSMSNAQLMVSNYQAANGNFRDPVHDKMAGMVLTFSIELVGSPTSVQQAGGHVLFRPIPSGSQGI